QMPRVNLHPDQGKPWPAPIVPPSPPPAAEPPRKKASAPLTLVLVLLVLAGSGAYVVHRALHRSEALQEGGAKAGAPAVKVVEVRRSAVEEKLTLRGTTLADQETSSYARSDGYHKG